MTEILLKLNLPETFVSSFCTFYRINKRRFLVLKDSLSLPAPRYRDMAWRLDVDIGRRSIANIADPSFMLRLDLSGVGYRDGNKPILSVFDNSRNNNSASTSAKNESSSSNSSLAYSLSQSSDSQITSLIFQSDYANMKHMQSELQKALTELNDTHAQRIARYIS